MKTEGLSGVQARLRVQQGFDMVSVSTDSTVVGEAMVQHLSVANGTSTPSILSPATHQDNKKN